MSNFFAGLCGNVAEMFVLTPWVLIFWSMALASVSIAIHELGHSMVARWCGVKTIGFRVGVGPGIRWRTSTGLEYSLGLYPLSGRVTYSDHWYHVSYQAKAAISAGGWFADTLTFLILLSVHAIADFQSPPAKLALLIALIPVLIGLTPLTGDGRAIVGSLWGWGRARRS